MKTTTPNRFIRWLLALTGADPNQTPIPPSRRSVDITVERNGDTDVAIIKLNDRDNNGHGRLVDFANVVYLIGEVHQTVDDEEEINIITDTNQRLIRVCAAPNLPSKVLHEIHEGDLVVLIGELNGECVQATEIHRLNTQPRKRIYGG